MIASNGKEHLGSALSHLQNRCRQLQMPLASRSRQLGRACMRIQPG
jgi:hypothetical protein